MRGWVAHVRKKRMRAGYVTELAILLPSTLKEGAAPVISQDT